MIEQFNTRQFDKNTEETETLSNYEINKQNIENNELYQKIKAELDQIVINPENCNEQGELLAPNNEVSNLSEEQWKTVRTPSFKKWFGDWEKKYNPEDLDNWAKAQYVKVLESDDLGYINKIIVNFKDEKIRAIKNKRTTEEIAQIDEWISDWNDRKIAITHEISKINADLTNNGFNKNSSDYGKLLDDNGEPLVVYRATNYGPNQDGNFEIPEVGKGNYQDGLGVKVGTFLGKKEEANFHHEGNREMGKESFLYSCFVNVKNTKVIDEKMHWQEKREEIEEIKNKYDGIIVKRKSHGDLFEDKKINLMDLVVFNPEGILIIDVE